jgi:hypothetical protein
VDRHRFVHPNFDVDADPYPDPDLHQNDGDPHASMFHFFLYIFLAGYSVSATPSLMSPIYDF